jgi:hypothetical protein
VGGEKVATGFLCGREYDTKRYVGKNLSGFDLLKERKKIFTFEPGREYSGEITVGLPAALHLHEDLPLWKRFFDASFHQDRDKRRLQRGPQGRETPGGS